MLNNAYKIKAPNYMIKILGCSRGNVFEMMKKIKSILGRDTSLQACNSPCFDGLQFLHLQDQTIPEHLLSFTAWC